MSTVKKRPQLSLDELRLFKWWLGGALTVIAAWSVFYLDVEAWLLLCVVTIAVPVVSIWPQLPARVPAWVHKSIFPLVVAYFAYDLYTSEQPLPAMVRLDVLLLLYRAVTYRRKRDDLQLVILGLFLTIIAGVLTVSLAFALQIIAFTACAMALMLVVTLIDSTEIMTAVAAGPLPSGEIPAWARVGTRRLWRRIRAAGDWRLVAFGGLLFGGVVTITVLLFLAIPRFQVSNNLFLDRLLNQKAHTGFSDTLRFNDVTDIQQDNTVAMRVEIPDRSQLIGIPYWRMVVLDEYRDSAFRVSPALSAAAFHSPVTSSEVQGNESLTLNSRNYWTFYLEAGVSRYLPLPGGFWNITFTEQQWYQASRSLRVVMLERDPMSMKAYRVYGVNLSGRLRDSATRTKGRDSGQERHRFQVAMPTMLDVKVSKEDRDILSRAAEEISGDAEMSAEDFAHAASAWLRTHHRYSLQIVIPKGPGDPLVRWLTSKQPGNCELFAGSLTLLARTAGFPTRVIAGFHGGVWNEDYLMVSNSEAHAWCEIFDGQDQWITIDPTPGSGPQATILGDTRLNNNAGLIRQAESSWSSRVDRLRVFWYRRIVNFERRDQMDLVRTIRETTEGSGHELRTAITRALDQLKEWWSRPWNLSRVGAILAYIAAALTLAWSWRSLQRGPWRRWWKGSNRNQDPVRMEAGRWLSQLRESGSRDAVCADLECLRYGPRESWPTAPKTVFRQARRAWKEQVRR